MASTTDPSAAPPPWKTAARRLTKFLLLAPAVIGALLTLAKAVLPQPHPYGLDARHAPRPFLQMPETIDGKLPRLLSQTGAFRDTPKLLASEGLIPYDLVVAFWSDGARKSRWISVPDGKIRFSPTGEWSFPEGTVFVKTFELPTDEAHPERVRRLETRLLVRNSRGGVYGVVYKWRADGSDADLLSSSVTERIPVRMADGTVREQSWYYPSRHDCLTCHTARAGGVLGVKTRQMNRDLTYSSGVTDNELRAWNHIGLFSVSFSDAELAQFPKLAAADDTTRSLEERARSYLDANCAQCHRPGGTVASFDVRYDTPLAKQGLIDGPVVYDMQIDRSRVIAPHDIWRSIAFMRVNTDGDIRMPPLARETIDRHGVALLKEWILSLPGRAVLDPPQIAPAGGNYEHPVSVVLTENAPGADIRYTLDGSAPGPSDARYQGPIRLEQPTVLRARAYKEGFTRSITSQQVFVFGTAH
jgi:uncharacterized repeat protein (TIGR03806 family)